MKKYIVVYIQSKWFALNIDDPEDYHESLPRSPNVKLISCQTADLVKYLIYNDSKRPLPHIVDLECIDKQMSQLGNDLRNDQPWMALKALRYYGIVKEGYKINLSEVRIFCEHLVKLYFTLLEKAPEERLRFEGLESVINTILYQRQSVGVNIDTQLASDLCHNLEKEIYLIKIQLQFKYNIFSPDNVEEQLAYLRKKRYNLLKSPLLTFKARRNEDEVCLLFYNMMRAIQDLDSLLFMLAKNGGENKCYPAYLGFGTITSRITLREPALQNIRRNNRIIIVPASGKKLLYVDYSQFEAGILASLSRDPDLIALYNEDIYKNLATMVLGDVNKRSDAKLLFYRFIYGDESIDNKTKQYFSRFKQLGRFKEDLRKELVEKNKIGTLVGNYRLRGEDNFEWFLSHKIQATASLIYKQAVIRVFNEVPSAKLIVPMHDATLYEIDEIKYDALKVKIQEFYRDEFIKTCPEINAVVKISDTFC
jgi:DNA polymerase I-like protein with 3'-5' exonuclease and polymerase domains